jgi:hypothetical protein
LPKGGGHAKEDDQKQKPDHSHKTPFRDDFDPSPRLFH